MLLSFLDEEIGKIDLNVNEISSVYPCLERLDNWPVITKSDDKGILFATQKATNPFDGVRRIGRDLVLLEI